MPTSFGPRSLSRVSRRLPGRVFMKGVEQIRRRNALRYESRNTVEQLVRDINLHGNSRRKAIVARIGVLLSAIGADPPRHREPGLRSRPCSMRCALWITPGPG